MPDIAARLTRKVGPLPVWAWAAVILGAFLAYNHFRGSASSAASPASASTSPTGPDATGAGAVGGASGGSSGQGNVADQIPPYLYQSVPGDPFASWSTSPGSTSPGGGTPTQTNPYASLGTNPLTGQPYGTTAADLGVAPSAIGGNIQAPNAVAGFGRGTISSRLSQQAPTLNLVGVNTGAGVAAAQTQASRDTHSGFSRVPLT